LEYNKLVKPLHEAVFPKARIYRKFLLNLRYGYKELLGLGLDNLFINQECEKLAFFLEERNGQGMSSCFVRSNYEWALLHIRVGNYELFGLKYESLQYLLPRV